MVFFAYSTECEMGASQDVGQPQKGLKQSASAPRIESKRDYDSDHDMEDVWDEYDGKQVRNLGGRPATSQVTARTKTKAGKKRRKHSNKHKWDKPTYIPAATELVELSLAERRLGTEAIKSILDRGKTHNGLIERARSGIDTSEPKTYRIQRWHAKIRNRDPMPDLDLPRDVKLHSSWVQLEDIKWRKDWHAQVMIRTKSHLDMELPDHVKLYQKRKRQQLRKLLNMK